MTRNARRRLILERHRSASCWRNKDIAKPAKKRSEPKAQPEVLKGWQQIAGFLGHPSAVVQRWASEGMKSATPRLEFSQELAQFIQRRSECFRYSSGMQSRMRSSVLYASLAIA